MNDTVSDEIPASDDTGIGCLVMLARFFRIAAEPAQLRHQLGITGRPAGIDDILTAAKSIGFRARQRSAKADQLAPPCVDGRSRDIWFLAVALRSGQVAQPLHVQNGQGAAGKPDDAQRPHRRHHAADMDLGQAERIGDCLLA